MCGDARRGVAKCRARKKAAERKERLRPPEPGETVVATEPFALANALAPVPKKRQSMVGEYVTYRYLNAPLKIGKLKTMHVGRMATIVPWNSGQHGWGAADTVYIKDIIGPATEQQLKDCGLFEVNP
jgi:hypothetical protein